MSGADRDKPVRGFLFACTDKTEKEFFERMLAGTNKVYGPIVMRIRKGDLIFIHNLDSDRLYGVFKSASDYGIDIQREAWGADIPTKLRWKAWEKSWDWMTAGRS